MRRLDSLKIINNLLDYLIHINDTNIKQKTLSAIKHYALNKHTGFDYSISYRLGDVCWIEFGDNLTPEMALNHMGIIFRKENNQTYYILPITTPKNNNVLHRNAYHPIINPSGNKRFRRLLKTECSFLAHDSLIKCMEPKLISVKRIISKVGNIQTNSELFNDIIDCTFFYLFPEYSYELQNIKKENSLLKMQLFLSNLKNNYLVNSLDELESVLAIPNDYRYELLIIETIDNKSNTCKIKLQLEDAFHQQISREILYTLK